MPEIATVVSGDVVHNQVDPVLGLSNPKGWQELIANIDEIERLSPEGGRGQAQGSRGERRGGRDAQWHTRPISDFGVAAENAVDAKKPKR
jgi:hypothetical protein